MTYQETIEKWKPEFGNIDHIRAVELIDKLSKIPSPKTPHKKQEIERMKRSILFLINKKL